MVNNLPIGIDSFRKIREAGKYYVDKTLMIRDFIQYGDEVALTIVERVKRAYMTVRIPNGEVRAEFIKIVANRARVSGRDLQKMFNCLFDKDMDWFMDIYQELVMSCTSYYDPNYHMLFLGMCISLRGLYKISSNIESGLGRSDIRMESLSSDRPHIIIEFKQGEDIDALKDEALRQIIDNRYFEGLLGEVLCMGVAHDKKRCAVAHETVMRSADR